MHSPIYKNELHKMYADKALYRIKIYRNCSKIHQNDLVQKDAETRQKFDFRMKQKISTLLPTGFKITAIHLVCCCSLPV